MMRAMRKVHIESHIPTIGGCEVLSVSELTDELERRIARSRKILEKNKKAIKKSEIGRLNQEMIDVFVNLKEIGDELGSLLEAYKSGNISEDRVRLVFSWLISSVDQLIMAGEMLGQSIILSRKAVECTQRTKPLVQRARDFVFET